MIVAAHILAIALSARASAIPSVANNEFILTQEAASRPLENFHAVRGQEFLRFCKLLSMPCGEEHEGTDPGYSTSDEHEALGMQILDMKNTTIGEVYKELRRRYPGYRWKKYGRVLVLEVVRKKSRSPLDVRLSNLKLKDKNLGQIARAVAKLGGLHESGYAVSGGYDTSPAAEAKRNRSLQINLTDASIREVLCAAVSAYGPAYWSVVRTPPENIQVGAEKYWLSVVPLEP